MKQYYEDLWLSLPQSLSAPDFGVRAGFLLGHVRPGQRILDLGCGDGAFTELLARRGESLELTAADVAEAALTRTRERLADAAVRTVLVPFDGDLPLQDNGFELVWASEVIEHVADTGHWLSEVRRVLAPGGSLLLTTPNHTRLRLAVGGIERFSPPLGDHLHLYNRASLTTLLNEFGFDPVDVRARGMIPGPLASGLTAQAHR